MIKPLTKSVWIGILLTTLMLLLFEWLIYKLGKYNYFSHKIILAIGGISFTGLLSFYSGAQTMFLASDKEAPFHTILDGLTKHPDWTFLLPYGDENIFLNLFGHMSEDPSMAWVFEQAERRRANPISIEDALDMLHQGKYYVLTSIIRVASNRHDEALKSITVFCDTAKIENPRAFLLPKNSPFKRAIDLGLIRMRNIGVLDMIIRKLRSKEVETKFASANYGSKGIDFQQVSLTFYMGSGVVVIALIILFGERCVRNKTTLT